jgi:hypothetical protein
MALLHANASAASGRPHGPNTDFLMELALPKLM